MLCHPGLHLSEISTHTQYTLQNKTKTNQQKLLYNLFALKQNPSFSTFKIIQLLSLFLLSKCTKRPTVFLSHMKSSVPQKRTGINDYYQTMISVIITHVPLCCLMPHISPHEGSTEQQPGIGVKPPRSSGLYPPEPPCWQDRWLSKITKDNVSSVETRGCSKE